MVLKWFRPGRKLSTLLLGIWLIIWGVLPFVRVFPYSQEILALLAILAGVLILLDR